MSEALHVIAWMGLAGGLVLALVGMVAWWAERRVLLSLLREIAPAGRFHTRAELVELKRRLSASIRWEQARMHDPRPMLRASARRVLSTGAGFCGENARVAVRLLRLGGVDAHRLYLEGARWGHVVVEHRWEGGWRLFDAHVDPRTALGDAQVGRIDTNDLGAFPNSVAENPWHRAYRIPGSGRLLWAEAIRPAGFFTALLETPSLVALCAGVALVLASAWALWRS